MSKLSAADKSDIPECWTTVNFASETQAHMWMCTHTCVHTHAHAYPFPQLVVTLHVGDL